MVENVSMKKAVAYTAVAKYTLAVVSIFFAAILSRLLTPDQYGTVAIITVILSLFQLFCDMGFGTAVIQDKGLTDRQVADIFSWTVYLGFALQFLFIGASFPISRFYDDSIYIPLGIILSFSLFLNSMNMIPNAVLLKNKKFKTITIRTIVASISSSLLTILLAYYGMGVYALVLQSVISAIITFVWNELTVRIKLVLWPSFDTIKRIWAYSFYQFLAQLFNFFSRNLDSLLIGKYLSKAELGQYNKSYHLMQMPISYIPGVVGPALHPILSERQDDPKYIYAAYLRILKILSLLGCFISVYLYYIGDELVVLLFGNQWHQAILPFKILALSVWFQLMTNTFGPIYLSIGKTKLMFRGTVASGSLIVASIIVGCLLGDIIYVALCVSIAYFMNFFLSFFIMIYWGFNESYSRFLLGFKHEVLFYVVLLLVTFMPFHTEYLLVTFVVKSAIITATYALLLIITKQYKLLMPIVPKRFRKA